MSHASHPLLRPKNLKLGLGALLAACGAVACSSAPPGEYLAEPTPDAAMTPPPPGDAPPSEAAGDAGPDATGGPLPRDAGAPKSDAATPSDASHDAAQPLDSGDASAQGSDAAPPPPPPVDAGPPPPPPVDAAPPPPPPDDAAPPPPPPDASLVCAPGHADCDGDPADGCETDLEGDPQNCGACASKCAAPLDGMPTCTGGRCDFACDASYHRCGTVCDSNTSTQSCGTACTPCVPPANSTATCNGVSCGFTCDGGYHQCGGACDDNGSVGSCGSSCTPCVAPPNATSTCNGVACGFTCNAGFADCDGVASNGCEVSLASDTDNCGSCGHSCAVGTAGSCAAGACQPGKMVQVSASNSNDAPIALTATTVWWASANIVAVTAKKGGAGNAAFQVNPSASDAVTGLALDGTNVYFATESLTTIAKMPLAGGPVTPIVNGIGHWYRLALTGTTLYSTTGAGADVVGIPLLGGSFQYAPRCNAITHVCRFNESYGIAADPAGVFFASSSKVLPFQNGFQLAATNGEVALDDTHLYWTDSATSSVWRANRDGTSPLQVASSAGQPVQLAVHDGHVYWLSKVGLFRAPASGATAQDPVVQLAGSFIGFPLSVAVDDGAIYWTDSTGALWGLAK